MRRRVVAWGSGIASPLLLEAPGEVGRGQAGSLVHSAVSLSDGERAVVVEVEAPPPSWMRWCRPQSGNRSARSVSPPPFHGGLRQCHSGRRWAPWRGGISGGAPGGPVQSASFTRRGQAMSRTTHGALLRPVSGREECRTLRSGTLQRRSGWEVGMRMVARPSCALGRYGPWVPLPFDGGVLSGLPAEGGVGGAAGPPAFC